MGDESQSKHGPITEDDVNAAQTAWCYALMTIGQVCGEGGDYKAVASQLIDDLYDYQNGMSASVFPAGIAGSRTAL